MIYIWYNELNCSLVNMKSRIVLFSATLILSTLFSAYGQKLQIKDWEFYQGNVGGLYEVWRSEDISVLPTWKKVSVPHCYNAFDAVDPDKAYYQGPAWYRTLLDIEKIPEHHKVFLHFEGVGQKSAVYINNKLVGNHIGGYNEFKIDISDAVQQELPENSGRIPLAVMADNSRDVNFIPSDLSDFNLYGGIYRKVWLEIVPDNYIESLRIESKTAKKNKLAEITFELSLQTSNIPLDVEIEIFSGDQSIAKVNKRLEADAAIKPAPITIKLKKPRFWSTDNPNLYTSKITLISSSGTHNITENFGIRSFEFVENGPFLLNGERLFLRGTHRHEDHAGYAQAMPDELIRKEMKMMKVMGVNFIRLGHYQQSEIVLDLCDSLGILVWEEIPWCRGGVGNATYKDQAHTMLIDMIDQHYNHPSIILWGLGNEQDWPGDFDWYSEDSVRHLMSSLNDLAHSLDSERKTCIRRCDFAADIVDVYSPSVWAGWYRGKYTDIMETSQKWNNEVPNFLHVEWGASHHPFRHSTNPDMGLENIETGDTDERDGDFLMEGGGPRVSKDGDWSVTYACNLIDWHLKEFEKMPWHTGAAYWPFKDFSTPLRPDNPIPYVNQKGVVQRDLTPKESYYVFQSYWTTQPMINIYGHTWLRRHGDAEAENMIKVYSNLARVEVLLNGKSLGTRERDIEDFPAAGLRWKAKYKRGENIIVAVSREKGKALSDTLTFYYQTEKWGEPVRLECYKHEISGDTARVYVWAIDKNGTVCLDEKSFVHFSVAGPGLLLDNMGTMGGSRKIQLANGQAFIEVKLNQCENIIAVSSENMKTGFLTIENKNNQSN